MSENEIIEYLKQNKEKGVAPAFMPQEVKDWCKKHQNENILRIYCVGGWSRFGVYFLSKDYKPELKLDSGGTKNEGK